MAVPNGPADTATFAVSNRTAISISTNTVVDGITFALGASSFTITASTGGGTFKEGGQTIFFNTSTARLGFRN